MAAKTKPIKEEEEVKQNPDPHIAQDFPGFPAPPSTRKTITPKTIKDKKTAAVVTRRKPKKTYGG